MKPCSKDTVMNKELLEGYKFSQQLNISNINESYKPVGMQKWKREVA